jgi:hypothetical protein
MPVLSRRLLLLPLSVALAHCGGGDGAATDLAAPPPVAADPYAGTAYLKVQVSTLAKGGGPGMARAVVQTLVDQCNEHRRSRYDLPPVQPDEALMAGIDVQTVERFYDNHKAAEVSSGYSLRLTDYQRWLDELTAGSGANPATPPQCAAVQKEEIQNGTLWLEGVKYDLRFKTREAIGSRGGASFTAAAIDSDDKVAAWPTKTVLGQTCRVASGPAIPANRVSCLWDRFPAKTYLNLPWALESVAGEAQEVRITALALERDKPLPAGAVAIPAGFSTKVSD